MPDESPVVLIGCGTMGGALLNGWLTSDRSPHSVTVIDPAPRTRPVRVACLAEPAKEMSPPRVLVLAIKPQMLAQAAPGLQMLANRDTILLSLLAAVDVKTLHHYFANVQAVVRAVPNLPASIGKGITALYGDALDERDRLLIDALVAPLGPVEWLDTEPLIDVATAISGCGPAFLFRYADAVIRAGVGLGMAPEQARRLIAETMTGAGRMLRESTASPVDMASAVASPGGVTRAGLARLDRGDGLATLIGETLAAAARRNEELATAARVSAGTTQGPGSIE